MVEQAAEQAQAAAEQDPNQQDKTATTPPAEKESTPPEGGDKSAETPPKVDDKSSLVTDAPPASKAPEKYDIKLPENSPLTSDKGILERTAAYAREQGLSNAEAQGLLDQKNQAVVDHVNAVNQIVDGWAEQSKNDPEIGGDKFAENCAICKRVVEKFGTPEFRKQLVDTGFGNHPEVVRFISKVGRAMKSDDFIPAGAKPATRELTAAEKFYGENNKEG